MELRGASLMAVSPNGRQMCLLVSSEGVQISTYREGQWIQQRGDTFPRDAPLCVAEIESAKPVYSTKLEANPFVVRFFRDSAELYVTGLYHQPGKTGNQQVVIDLEAKRVKEEEIRVGLFQTTRGQQLLTMTGELGKGGTLSLVELPDYNEVARVDMEIPASGRSGTDQVLSAQGDRFVYGVDDAIVCRRTRDLSVLWRRTLGTRLSKVWRVAISARGDRVAGVATSIPSPLDLQAARRPLVLQPQYIGVYDGYSGADVARFPADTKFSNALALSPDGKLLAAAQRVPDAFGHNMDLFVDIYDIASGRQISRELHCRVAPASRYQNLASFGAVEFTSDGRYLVATGYDRSKVWEVSA